MKFWIVTRQGKAMIVGGLEPQNIRKKVTQLKPPNEDKIRG